MREDAAAFWLRRLLSVVVARPVVPLVSRGSSPLFTAPAPASLLVASIVGVTDNDLQRPGRVLLVDRWVVPRMAVSLMASAARPLVVAMAPIVIGVVSVAVAFMIAARGNRIANVLHRPLVVTLVLVPLLRRRPTRLQRRPLDAISHEASASLHEYARLVVVMIFGRLRISSSLFEVI